MIAELCFNTVDSKSWWFDLGISFQRSQYRQKNWVFTLALGFMTLYLRW